MLGVHERRIALQQIGDAFGELSSLLVAARIEDKRGSPSVMRRSQEPRAISTRPIDFVPFDYAVAEVACGACIRVRERRLSWIPMY
ncbi:MAG TPA: hypothetical protein VIQ99_00015 [Gammaproteobacteria bacterium]